MYFEKFPTIEYEGIDMHDITIRYKINELVRDSVNTYEQYKLSYGERPEDVSYRLYDSVTFHWVILLMNDISNPLDEWFKTDEELELLISEKYVSGDDIHHWLDSEGYFINDDQGGGSVSVTNREFEELINDERRNIKVLRPEYLYQLINEFEKSING